MIQNSGLVKQYKKETRRYRFLLIYSLLECALLWLGLHSPVPALVIVVNILLALYKALIASINIEFYKKQGFYHGYHNANPDECRWPFVLFLAMDIAAIVFCTRNTVVFLVISAVYTLTSLVVLFYTQTEYERIRDIMDGPTGEYPVRIR